MARLNARVRRDRAVVLIETAIVLLFLLFLTFGALEYGWIMLKMSQVNNAARNGARTAAMRLSGAQATAQSSVDAMMAAAGINDYTVTFAPEGGVDGATAGTLITVTIVADYEDNTDVDHVSAPSIDVGLPFPVPDQLRASVTMAKE